MCSQNQCPQSSAYPHDSLNARNRLELPRQQYPGIATTYKLVDLGMPEAPTRFSGVL